MFKVHSYSKRKKKKAKLKLKKTKKTVVVAFKPPDEYPWQGRNSFLYYKIVLCNKYKYNILFFIKLKKY